MSPLPATPAAHRRELRHRERARLEAMEAKLDAALVKMEVGSRPLPTPTEEDVQWLAERLGEDDSWLPKGTVVSVRTELFPGRSAAPGSEHMTIATSVSLPMLGNYTPRELLEAGLVTRAGDFSPSTYERLLSAQPGVISGRLIGPREEMLARQEAGQKARPGLWHAND